MSVTQKYRAIVAHFDPVEQRRISRLLQDTNEFEVIFVTNSGEACVRRAVSCDPDLVVAEANLGGIDGLEAIRQIKARCARTKILFLTCYEKLLRHPITLANANYSILAPYTAALIAERALDLVRPEIPEFSAHQIFEQATVLLTVFGVPPRMAGHPCVRDGVLLSVLNPKVLSHHTGPEGLYAQLCARHGVPYKVMEHRIRSVGIRIYNSPNFFDVLGQYFPPNILERDRIPNLALITALAARVTDDLRAAQHQPQFLDG